MNTTECRERGVARVPFKRALLACLPDCRRHGLAKDAAPEQGETHKGGPTRRGPRRRDPQRREGADLEQGEPMWARSGLLLSQGAVLRPGGGYLGVGAVIQRLRGGPISSVLKDMDTTAEVQKTRERSRSLRERALTHQCMDFFVFNAGSDGQHARSPRGAGASYEAPENPDLMVEMQEVLGDQELFVERMETHCDTFFAYNAGSDGRNAGGIRRPGAFCRADGDPEPPAARMDGGGGRGGGLAQV
eukprot:1152442-Pelagomonas_calceolata.AAC.4